MKIYFLVFALLSVVYAAPRADDLKFVSIEDNEIPVKKLKGVSAHWGGYRAGAGLGGSESGGALFAGAEAPGVGASAGLGGSGAGASAYSDYDNNKAKGGFFDRIFAIPINVLHSVNAHVKSKNNGHEVHAKTARATSGASANVGEAGAEAGATVGQGPALKFAGEDATAGSASAYAGSGSHVHHRNGAKPDYDKIFNIPITALKSVNDFLNG